MERPFEKERKKEKKYSGDQNVPVCFQVPTKMKEKMSDNKNEATIAL